ncbi:unnamed protein product [Bemisia tabaci]|uniref:Cyclin D n=1 Tax=Bemisia tabaci TaxID=7038 RepID=A0A9P0EWE7_BEMTA|nr:unnamed protein product [Bemisia tabaci]
MSSMDLLCCENGVIPDEVKAYIDPILINDDRVLENLLRDDAQSSIKNYFVTIQREITPKMRELVAEWMWEVCEEQQCQEEVFALAMNYMDRFLCTIAVKKTQLQLLGTACLLVSSKLKETIILQSNVLVAATDSSFSLHDLQLWESLVLSKLKWDMAAVLPHDFIYYLVRRIDKDLLYDYSKVQKHAHFLIAMCVRDFKFSVFSPCVIAIGCITAALDGLDWLRRRAWTMTALNDRFSQITGINKNIIQNCTDAVQSMVAASISNYVAMKCQNPEEKSPDLTTFPATPPDVADVSHLNF